ncbi:geranylgeranyl pyrophosphate synthetase [Boeremia exigua]|uniref:geranylgeranyl pyrophosphate synthetase n=1 Tax=Boeremia exigua TaxID=749465 RepID=UPI001E8E1F55|nr:geranylgeranyl pyrophosphate synthetase [Boeremia exigua]KAH6616883.1 geranylgeranyl pyrophosphate synthetase [Boeremia exigua]
MPSSKMTPEDSMKITRSDLKQSSRSPGASIDDVQHLASYNWIDALTPVVVVPGVPPLWSPPRLSQQLPKDSGLVYINQNAARHPDSPLEPLFRALYMTKPSFDIGAVNVVTDRNNIRKLLSFVMVDVDKERPDSFTIDVEMVKNTALLCRNSPLNQEHIGPHDFRGYGHEFERTYTKTQIPGSTGHHRIISYRFCGMTFVVRHETDGYYDSNAGNNSNDSASTGQDGILAGKLSSLSISPSNEVPCHTTTGSKLATKTEGYEVPLSATLEIKTRASHRVLHIADVAPQLWVSQTPNLVRAYHCRGRFEVPLVEDVSDDIKSWELEHEQYLQDLALVIQKISDFAKQCGGKAVVTYDRFLDTLVLRKAELKRMLPDDLYRHWTDRTDSFSIEQTRDELIPQPEVDQMSQTMITIGDQEYSIDISQIPYLSSFSSFQRKANPNEGKLAHGPIPLFDVALKGLESGYRHCFRGISADLSQYHTLCDTYELLGVDVCSGQTLDELVQDLKAGKSGYELEYKYYTSTRGDKTKARDAAFKFLYLLLLGEFQDEHKVSAKVYSAVLFVISHPATFRSRARMVIRLAYEERFVATKKQKADLDKWDKKFAEYGQSEEDVTTSEESVYVDSDSS